MTDAPTATSARPVTSPARASRRSPGHGRRRLLSLAFWTALIVTGVSGSAVAVDPQPSIALEEVLSGLDQPVAVAHAGDARLFIVLKRGVILVHDPTSTDDTPPAEFLDISHLVADQGERGLLGLAFHPDYDHPDNRFFFVYYTALDGAVTIARYQTRADDPDRADAASGVVLLAIPHGQATNHNGGGLVFGPDGYLYAAVGDGGGGGDPNGNGQNLSTLLGKVLRLDVDVTPDVAPYYEIPPTNPFVDLPNARGEIWAWGLRNPWRITFDRETGDLFIADVGQNAREEVNFQPATDVTGQHGGRNYGWRRMEGTACFKPSTKCQTGSLVLPILEYTHALGCSVTGGYRYRGAAIPALHGGYVFGDFCSGRIWVGVEGPGGAWSRTELLDTPHSISSFGEDANGELYVAHLGGDGNGALYRIVASSPRLTVGLLGAGSGQVTADHGGIACAPTCVAQYPVDDEVTLTAEPAAAARFAGWGGACSGTGDCVLTMGGHRSVTATFQPRPVLQFAAAAYTRREGDAPVKVTVRRTGDMAGTVTATLAVGGGGTATPTADFRLPATTTLSFPPGVTKRSLKISIVNDRLVEGTETVPLILTALTNGAVLGAQSTATLSLRDNDRGGVVQFKASKYQASEGAGTLTVSVKREDGSGGGVSVDVVAVAGGTADGADYTLPATPVRLAFGPGQKTATFQLLVSNDADDEPAETVVLELQNPQLVSLGARKQTTVTIVDDDP